MGRTILILGMEHSYLTYADWIEPDRLCREFNCFSEGSESCCDGLWCTEHYEYYHSDCEELSGPCEWCGGTGFYSGPMLNNSYAGPCLVCNP